MRAQAATSLFDPTGQRKYLNVREYECFLAEADRLPLPSRAFCYLLAETGCRISEALEVTPARIESVPNNEAVTFRTLKRRRVVFRTVPVPLRLVQMLAPLIEKAETPEAPLWRINRTTAWRCVVEVMHRAGITGRKASPRGLRHCFGVRAVIANVPLNLLQRWMGHATPITTMIYLDFIGAEERDFAKRMWGK